MMDEMVELAPLTVNDQDRTAYDACDFMEV